MLDKLNAINLLVNVVISVCVDSEAPDWRRDAALGNWDRSACGNVSHLTSWFSWACYAEGDACAGGSCTRWVYGHVIGAEMLDKLNGTTELVLEQTTPRRVEHRRAMLVRKRTVHSMQAEMDPSGDPHLIRLRLRTQAGTYIKARLLPVFPVIIPSPLATGRYVILDCHAYCY